ncbi:TonB-dependent receptor [Zhouia sp. PK063]|uniref:TonB-dependent receptor n=1 Tax=Zhouia sp. PK063 TaxID=3373602 RepID=UPI0037B88A8B
MQKKLLFIFFAMLLQYAMAQQDTIHLKDVVLSDAKLYHFNSSQKITRLKDSILQINSISLTNLLNFNSTIYFKENGFGMVSSPSFRGGTASQTAVLWNGININSQINGQTDFNTIALGNYDDVAIKAGGGSVLYGSGAIGGTIHLNTVLDFKPKFDHEIFLKYGSFNTLQANYKASIADDSWSAKIGVVRNSSDNDYKYYNSDKRNENGAFYNTGANAAIAYKINEQNQLHFYSTLYDGEREFSGTLTAPSRSKYADFNFRNLIEWQGTFNRYTSKTQLVYLKEDYKYFENKNAENYTYGNAKTIIAKYDGKYQFNNNMVLNGVLNYQHTSGNGSDIASPKRNIYSNSLLFQQQLSKQFLYNASVRQEWSDVYKSPLLFSIGTVYQPVNFYQLKFNFSRNYRMPTFNDLFWQSGGNPDLNAEKSYQAEIGNQFYVGNIIFSITGFYNKIDDMIRWLPNNTGIWQPENTDKVTSAGAEAYIKTSKKIGEHQLTFVANYAFTTSVNDATKKQLIYVPYHKASGNLSYHFKKWSAFFQQLWVSDVYTSSDNSFDLKGYFVSNLGIQYQLMQQAKLGVTANNIFNEKYMIMPSRPMPRTYINTTVIINF